MPKLPKYWRNKLWGGRRDIHDTTIRTAMIEQELRPSLIEESSQSSSGEENERIPNITSMPSCARMPNLPKYWRKKLWGGRKDIHDTTIRTAMIEQELRPSLIEEPSRSSSGEERERNPTIMRINRIPSSARMPKLPKYWRNKLWGGRKDIHDTTICTAMIEQELRPSLIEESSRSSSGEENERNPSCSGIAPFKLPFEEQDTEQCFENKCMVCLEGTDEEVQESHEVLPCGHIYHRCCLQSWRFQHDSCPTCRYNLNYHVMSC
jgi:hypothetical protein